LIEAVARLSTVESSAPRAFAERIRAMVDRELSDTTWAELALAEDG
jgi:hypothetical protein